MRAIVLETLNGPDSFAIREWPNPVPATEDVVVEVRAVGLNRRDAYVSRGLYPGVSVPGIPGSDASGVVVSVPSGDPENLMGQAVLVNPALDWGPDERTAGSGFTILGIPRAGTLAELVSVPRENVVPLPAHLSWEEGAALGLGGLTAYRALVVRGALQRGQTVLIPGAGGGVATLLIQMATALGAHVVVTSSHPDKLTRARSLGAEVAVDYGSPDWVEEIRRRVPAPIDLVVDGVGGPVFPSLVRLLRPGGRLVSYGATRGPVPSFVLPQLFLKQVDVLGTTMGSPADFRAMVRLVQEAQIRPVVDAVWAWDEAPAAVRRLEDGRQFGKLVLWVGAGDERRPPKTPSSASR